MIDLPKPDVILTHESDLDGLVAGLLLRRLAQKLHGVAVPLQSYHNHSWRQRAMPERCAWVTDFTFEPRLDRLSWVVIDHHPTDTTPQKAQLVHDPEKSAGLLCYELCREAELASPALDRLVHLSNVADLFQIEDPEFGLASDYANLVKAYGFWNLHALIEGGLERLLDHPLIEVMAVKRRVENPLGLAWSRANILKLSPTVGYVETVIGNSNMIVHELLAQAATPYSVLVTLFRKGTGLIIVSLRSRNGEALRLATQLQGGGHPNAAGTTLPRAIQNIPDAIGYLRQFLAPAPPSREAGLASLEGAFAALERGRQ